MKCFENMIEKLSICFYVALDFANIFLFFGCCGYLSHKVGRTEGLVSFRWAWGGFGSIDDMCRLIDKQLICLFDLKLYFKSASIHHFESCLYCFYMSVFWDFSFSL